MPPEETNEEIVTEEQTAEEVEGLEPESTEEQEHVEDEAKEKEGDEQTLSHPDALAALTKTRAEAAASRVKLRELEKQLEGAKTPAQVEEIVGKLKTERETAEQALVVENVALKHGLPADLAAALKGSTREELEAHALVLAKYVPSTDEEDPDLSGGLRPDGSSDGAFDPVAEARKARRRRH